MHNERSNDTDLSAMGPLVELRNRIGYVYGSEDTCTLFYALVRRERPVNIVELGAGLGVTALWMAQAVKENGAGRVWTLDDASHWQDPKKRSASSSTTPRRGSSSSWSRRRASPTGIAGDRSTGCSS